MMKTQEQKDITCKKIAWTIRGFGSLKTDERHYSEVFIACHCAWRLLVYRGRTNSTSLAIYLSGFDASNLPQGASVNAAFSLTLVNQLSRTKSLTKGDAGESANKFCKESYEWGYNTFMPLKELENPYNGYILNDQCIVQVEVFSVTFEGTEPTSRSKNDDVLVEFKDLGTIEKSFVPLLEEVCSWHPSLLDCTKNKSRRFTEWLLTALGRLLQFLKNKKWKDMDEEEACEELGRLWEELGMMRLHLTWLEPLVKSALNMRGYAEKAERVKKLKQNVVVLETEINIIKQNLARTEQSVEMVKQELTSVEQNFQDKDLDAKILYV